MAQISVQTINKNDIVLSYTIAASSSGDTASNFYFDLLINVKNDNSVDIEVCASALVPCDQSEYHSLSETVSAGTIKTIPITSRLTNWSTKNSSLISCSPFTSVKIAAFRQLK